MFTTVSDPVAISTCYLLSASTANHFFMTNLHHWVTAATHHRLCDHILPSVYDHLPIYNKQEPCQTKRHMSLRDIKPLHGFCNSVIETIKGPTKSDKGQNPAETRWSENPGGHCAHSTSHVQRFWRSGRRISRLEPAVYRCFNSHAPYKEVKVRSSSLPWAKKSTGPWTWDIRHWERHARTMTQTCGWNTKCSEKPGILNAKKVKGLLLLKPDWGHQIYHGFMETSKDSNHRQKKLHMVGPLIYRYKSQITDNREKSLLLNEHLYSSWEANNIE